MSLINLQAVTNNSTIHRNSSTAKIYYTLAKQKMFQPSYIEPPSSGKKIHGLPTRREPSFSLGWDQSHQLNSFQKKKGMEQQVTGKITNNLRQEPRYQQPQQQQQFDYDDALEREKLKQLYEKLSYEHPDIPPQELERYIYQQDQQRRDSRPQQPRQQPPSQQGQQQYERRAPIKQKDSMKDIIYNGVGVGSSEEQRAASRRNNSNLVLGDGYNYFKENGRPM